MQIAMIGLGRMGGNMAARLVRAGHTVFGYDILPEARERARANGIVPVDSLEAAVAAFSASPRVFWVMTLVGDPTTETLRTLAQLGETGDICIDGGNTHWKRALSDAEIVKAKGLEYVDAGTSGGIWGLTEGYSLMVGGSDNAYTYCLPIFEALAPHGPNGEVLGLVHTGPEASGHFVKAVHNMIEYGLMQAYAEGFQLMREHPSFKGMDMLAIAHSWQHGSVVRSWLLDLIARGLAEDPDLTSLAGWVDDTGEGRWTLQDAIDAAVPVPVAAAALFERFRSRQDNSYADRMLAMMRNQFGGHAVKKA